MTNLFGLIWKAEYYSRNFCFTAYGLTDKQALDSLYMGLEAHREEFDLANDWYDEADINHEAWRIGSAYRDDTLLYSDDRDMEAVQ